MRLKNSHRSQSVYICWICKKEITVWDEDGLCFDCGMEDIKMQGQELLNGKKNDQGKPNLDLVPKSLIWAIGDILTSGANKYGRHNWRAGLLWSRPYAALLRHLTAWWDGEDKDTETGRSHLWHAAAELAFLIEYEEKKIGSDDRYK